MALLCVSLVLGGGSFLHLPGDPKGPTSGTAGPLWTPLRPQVAPPLTITAFTAAPASVFTSATTQLNVSASGGAPPYSYWYQGLPTGCTTANVSSLLCRPTASQHWVIEVTVNDTVGTQANATANLTVTSGFGPPPRIVSFSANPSPAEVGHLMHFVAAAESQSGTPTFALSYAFLGLPTGCTSFNQTNLSCIPSGDGTFKVWVRVTDSYSNFNQTFLLLNVTGGPAASGGGSSLLGGLGAWVLGALLAAAVVSASVLLVRSRRRPPSPRAGLGPAQPADARPPR